MFDDPSTTFCEYYRCPEDLVSIACSDNLSQERGYFSFGTGTVCYGHSSAGFRARQSNWSLYDVEQDIKVDRFGITLPFNPEEISWNLRHERYTTEGDSNRLATSALRSAYYFARPFLPLPVRKHLQRIRLNGWQQISFPRWPVGAEVDSMFEQLMVVVLRASSTKCIPFIWFWPDGFPAAAIMTHDVETIQGRDYCRQLMDLDESFGIKSSFQLIPEHRYPVAEQFVDEIWERGFEVNVHDLNHDGHLLDSFEVFKLRAQKINDYGRRFRAAGFRSAALYRCLDWWEHLGFAYDMSAPSIGHLEAQQGGCCSVMPFFVRELVELPVTTTQDHTLFNILNERSIDLWKKQIDLISSKHGLMSFIVHPDYVVERSALNTYTQLLSYLACLQADDRIWMALPHQVNDWWRQRNKMRLIYDSAKEKWTIQGNGKERARIAYATLEGDRIVYNFEPSERDNAEEFLSMVASEPAPAD